jgi:hypothetical protein
MRVRGIMAVRGRRVGTGVGRGVRRVTAAGAGHAALAASLPVWNGHVWDGSVWDGSVWDGSVWDGSVWDGSVWDGSIWN